MDGAPTIKTLAKMAGVSNATVSLALRNHPRIRPGERARIQRIAAQAGYKPNPVVSHLFTQLRLSKATGYQSTLALVYTGKDPALLKEVPTFREWIAGCEARASSLGYGFDRFSLAEPEIAPDRLRQILHARNINGVVLIGPFEGNLIPPELDCIWRNCATVVIGVRPIRPLLAFVSNDQFSTAAEAVREVLRLGYKRPGLCVNAGLDAIVENRFSGGFLTTQHKLPPSDQAPIFDFAPDAERRFQAWVKQFQPDVILTLHAAELSEWMKAMNLSVPRDMGLVHLDRTSDLEAYAGMQQNNDHVGRATVDLVIGQLQRNEFGLPPFQKSMLITGTWIPGPTVRMQDGPSSRSRASASRARPAQSRGK